MATQKSPPNRGEDESGHDEEIETELLDVAITEDLAAPASGKRDSQDAPALRIAVNRPVPIEEIRAPAEAKRKRLADAKTHVGPVVRSSSSD